MPIGVYVRTEYHKKCLKDASNSGRFKKGHPFYKGGEKGWFKKGMVSWCKGKKLPQKSGKNHPNWKGGKTKDKLGYILIKNREHPFCSPIGYAREHRLVIEKQIGRYLLPKEEIHHLGKKGDNRVKKLMAFTNHSAHRRFEGIGIVNPEEIIFDGRNAKKERKI